MDLEELALDRDLKGKGVIQELKDQPFQPDIPFLLREYVGRLADIHQSVRKALKLKVGEWNADIRGAVSDYAAAFPEIEAVGLCVMCRHPDRTATKLLDVVPQLIERLGKVERLNCSLKYLGRAYVSSEYVPLTWKNS